MDPSSPLSSPPTSVPSSPGHATKPQSRKPRPQRSTAKRQRKTNERTPEALGASGHGVVEDSITVAIRPEPEAMGKVADSIEVGTPQPETRAAKRKREMPRRAASPKEESSDDTVMVGESSPLLQPSSSSKKQQRKKQDQEQHEQPPPKENKSAGTTKPTRHSARTTARRASISRDGVDAGLMARDTGASEVASVAATPLKKTPLVKAKGAESARTNGTTSNKKSRLSKRWDTEFVLEDPKSPLVKASIRSILTHPLAWSVLTPEEQASILAKFPDQRAIVRPSPSDAPPPSSPQRQSQSSHPNSVAEESNKGDPSLSLPHPSIPFLLSSDGFRHDAARYVERLAEGRHDRQWLVEAMCAHGRRAAGEFDEFIRRRVEEDWDVTLPEGLGVVVRKGAATAVGNRDGSATAATNGVVVEAGEEKTQDMPGEAGDETAREYVTARREVVKSDKRPTATREDYAISSIEVGQNDPGHETRETAFTCTGGPTNTVEPTRAPDIASRPAPSVVEESPINEEQPQKAEQGEATGATNLAGRPLANDMGKSRGPEIGSGGSGDGS